MTRTMTTNLTTHTKTPGATPSEDQLSTVQRLLDLATRGLVPMFDERTHLFCHKLNHESGSLVREGQSPRYTVITLMGLHRLEQNGGRSPIAIEPALQALLTNTAWVDNAGDLGLLVWLCAQLAPERLDALDARLGVKNALQQYPDAQKGQTMELAWLLTGLCYWGLARPEKLAEMRGLAFEIYGRLKSNQGKHGIFGHASRKGSLAGRTRGWIGSFADQV